jgi:PRTRC genetic system protein A
MSDINQMELGLKKREPQVVTPISPAVLAVQRGMIDYVVDFEGDPYTVEVKKPKTFVLRGDGLWCIFDRPFARFVAKLSDVSYPALPANFKAGFRLKIPKFSGKDYAKIVELFRSYVAEGYSGASEALTQIFWDSNKQEYFVNIPIQVVNGAAVHYDFSKQDVRTKELGVFHVFDIHSHNTMSAFFSGTDDTDEQGSYFFGVVGHLNDDRSEHSFRFGIDGVFTDIEPEEVIDLASYEVSAEAYPKEWRDNISMDMDKYSPKEDRWGMQMAQWDRKGYGKLWGEDDFSGVHRYDPERIAERAGLSGLGEDDKEDFIDVLDTLYVMNLRPAMLRRLMKDLFNHEAYGAEAKMVASQMLAAARDAKASKKFKKGPKS